MFTEEVSEVMYPLLYEYPDSFAAGTHASTWAHMGAYHRGWLLLKVGDMAATSTLDVSIRQASDAAGTGAKAITGKSITQLTAAGGDGDDVLCIELRNEELDVTGGFEHVQVRVVVANAAVELDYTFFGCTPRFMPTPTTNWTERVA
jgi:hypothetical protein